MTRPTVQAPALLSTFLFGRDTRDTAAQFLVRVRGLGLAHPPTAVAGLSQAAQQMIGAEVCSIAATLCDLNLGEIALAGWRTHTLIHEAATATLGDPGTPRVVDLASHKITSIHRPGLDVVVDGATVAHIEFQLTLQFILVALTATVRDGRLVSLQPGQCTLSAALTIAGVEVIRREAKLDLGALCRIGVDGHTVQVIDDPTGQANADHGHCGTGADRLQVAFPWGNVDISETRLLVGRAPDLSPLAEHLAEYDGVSRNHAELWQEHGRLFVRDSGSSNGTYVNETRLAATVTHELRLGDNLRFGNQLRTFVIPTRGLMTR